MNLTGFVFFSFNVLIVFVETTCSYFTLFTLFPIVYMQVAIFRVNFNPCIFGSLLADLTVKILERCYFLVLHVDYCNCSVFLHSYSDFLFIRGHCKFWFVIFVWQWSILFLDLLQKISKLDFKPRCLRVKSETVKEEQTKLQTKHIWTKSRSRRLLGENRTWAENRPNVFMVSIDISVDIQY